MAQVFISYAREDEGIARRLADVLVADGCEVWWDEELLAGREFDQVIERELHDAKAVVVIWSPDSVVSRWVRSEASDAADRGVLVPITIRHAVAPIQFRIIQGIEMSNWNGRARLDMSFWVPSVSAYGRPSCTACTRRLIPTRS